MVKIHALAGVILIAGLQALLRSPDAPLPGATAATLPRVNGTVLILSVGRRDGHVVVDVACPLANARGDIEEKLAHVQLRRSGDQWCAAAGCAATLQDAAKAQCAGSFEH